jgi:hypothetical protein
MNSDPERVTSAGDRAVAIAALLAIVAIEFFGEEPRPVVSQEPACKEEIAAQDSGE